MKNKVIIILVCIAVYSTIGIVLMVSLQSITALLRLQDVGADIIGWFIYIGSVPHGLRFVYATYIEKYRKQSMVKTQNVAVFGALLAFACLFPLLLLIINLKWSFEYYYICKQYSSYFFRYYMGGG